MITLPSYDFPEKAGYVAPGVNLMIKDVEQKTIDGHDVFVTKDVTISVTTKPKLVYSSSATHWANDAYKDRLLFPEEHEIDGSGVNVSRETKTALVFLRDSMRQFQLMNIPGDYERITEGDNYKDREQLRLGTLLARIESTKAELDTLAEVTPILEEVKIKAENLQAALSGEIISQKYCSSEFQILGNKVDAALKLLDQLHPRLDLLTFRPQTLVPE